MNRTTPVREFMQWLLREPFWIFYIAGVGLLFLNFVGAFR